MANASMLSYEEKREVALAYLCGVAKNDIRNKYHGISDSTINNVIV